MKVKWIAWQNHRRTEELCSYLGIKPTVLDSNSLRIFKHPLFVLKTIREIYKGEIETLIVQNPSIILTLVACLLRRVRGYKLVVDTHNAGIQPEDDFLKKLDWLYRYFQREANLTVVTNETLAGIVKNNGGIPFVMPDRLPNPKSVQKETLKGRRNLVYICTYGIDEPFIQVLDAAKELPKDYVLYVTGNYNKAIGITERYKQENIVFTGYLDEDRYWRLLGSCDLVIDLTNRDNCLVCGAYEAVSVGTPLILSSKLELMKYFYRGCVYTDNSLPSIIKAVHEGINDLERLRTEINQLRDELQKCWEKIGIDFRNVLLAQRNHNATYKCG